MKVVRSLRAIAVVMLAMPAFGYIPVSTTARVPFDFEVNGRMLPAGVYRFEMGPQDHILRIRDAKGHGALTSVLSVSDTKASKRPGVAFTNKEGRMKLDEVRVTSSPSGLTYRVK